MVQQVVGHLVEQRVGVEVEAALGAVPRRVAEAPFASRSRRRSRTIEGYPGPGPTRAQTPARTARRPPLVGTQPATTDSVTALRPPALLAARSAWSSWRSARRAAARAASNDQGTEGLLPGRVRLRAGARPGAHEGREEPRPSSSRWSRRWPRTAPEKIREDAETFVDALRRVRDDPSLAKNKQFQARRKKAVDNVNRYASNGCGFFKQDPSEGI